MGGYIGCELSMLSLPARITMIGLKMRLQLEDITIETMSETQPMKQSTRWRILVLDRTTNCQLWLIITLSADTLVSHHQLMNRLSGNIHPPAHPL